MKKIIIGGFIIFLVVFLAGCGGSSPDGDSGGDYTLTINISGQGTTDPESGRKYMAGATSTIQPLPYATYYFLRWSGPNSGELTRNANGWSIMMDGNKTITAEFATAPVITSISGGSNHTLALAATEGKERGQTSKLKII